MKDNIVCWILAETDIWLIFLFGHLGKELYSRNLKLLVPFFDHPSITLQKIEKVYLLFVQFMEIQTACTWKKGMEFHYKVEHHAFKPPCFLDLLFCILTFFTILMKT